LATDEGIVGARAAGGVVVAVVATRRGSPSKPGPASALALAIVAAGELTIGLAPGKPLAMITCASVISACALAALLVPAIGNARPPQAVRARHSVG
jgi:hypothetical protein